MVYPRTSGRLMLPEHELYMMNDTREAGEVSKAGGQKTGPGFVVIVQEKEDKDLNPDKGNEIGEGRVSSRNSQR